MSVIFLWGMLIYANSVNGRFQFDDYPVIVHNPVIRTTHLGELWNSVRHPTRFLAYVTFALNYRLNGLDPAGYHIVNILIHLINAVLVFQLIRLIFQTPWIKKNWKNQNGTTIAAVCALLFVSHPVQTESVTYITQRFTSLAVFFYLASLCFFLAGRLKAGLNKNKAFLFFVLSGVCAAGGMLTKQITLTLPLMILLSEWMFFERSSKQTWLRLTVPAVLFFLLIPGMYLFDAAGILSITHDSGSHRGDLITSQSYALTQPRVVMTYLRLLVFPVNQNLLYDFRISERLSDAKTLLSLVSIVFLFLGGLRLYKVNRLYSFGIFWFLITLMVESTVIPIRHVIFEHRVYLPSVGFFLAAAVLLFRLTEKRNVFVPAGVIIVLIFSVLTVKRNLVWKDGVTMWQDVVRKSPGQARPYYNLGYEYLKSRDLDPALQNFSKALEINPEYFDAYNNRSQVYFDLGKLDKAFEDISRAIRLNDQRAEAYLNRGMIIRQMGQYEPAIQDFSRAISLDPQNYIYYTNRGMAYGNTGQYGLALNDLNKALELNPEYARAYNIRGAVHLSLAKRTEALEDFNRAVRFGVNDPDVYRNRARLLQDSGEYDLASRDLNKVIELRPDDLDSYLNRAYLLTKVNKLDEALNDYNRILAKDPSQSQIYMEKGKIYYRLQQYRRAADEFDHALKQSPDNASGYLLKGLCHYELKQYQQALSDVNRAKELGHPVDENYLIRIRNAMGRPSS